MIICKLLSLRLGRKKTLIHLNFSRRKTLLFTHVCYFNWCREGSCYYSIAHLIGMEKSRNFSESFGLIPCARCFCAIYLYRVSRILKFFITVGRRIRMAPSKNIQFYQNIYRNCYRVIAYSFCCMFRFSACRQSFSNSLRSLAVTTSSGRCWAKHRPDIMLLGHYMTGSRETKRC